MNHNGAQKPKTSTQRRKGPQRNSKAIRLRTLRAVKLRPQCLPVPEKKLSFASPLRLCAFAVGVDGPRQGGYSLVELVAVMMVVGILAAVVLPKLGDTSVFRALAFHDDVVSALRYGQKVAVSHRRLVCAVVTGTSVTLSVATNNPATSCSGNLIGPDGNSAYAHSGDPDHVNLVISPAGPLYFQPDGRITSDAAGSSVSNYSLTVADLPAISVNGSTGYVQ